MAIYHYKGRVYHAAVCEACGAALTMTDATVRHFHKGTENALMYFDAAMPCCERPDYYWRVVEVDDVR